MIKQMDKTVQISVLRLKRAGAARLANTIGADKAALVMPPGEVCWATYLKYNDMKMQYARRSCRRSE